MQDIYTELVSKVSGGDWGALFSKYDKDHDNLLDKNELRELIRDCGPSFAEVTEAEVAFAFNVMALFQKHLKKAFFLEWATSMRGRSQKALIYYS